MSTDLDQLLRDASHAPTAPLDPDELWRSGRRRRWLRRAGAVTTAMVLVLGLAIAGPDLVGVQAPEIAPVGQSETGDVDRPEGATTDEPADEPADETGDSDPDPVDEPASEPAVEAEGAPESEPEPEPEAEAETEPAPEPDPAAVADPCEPHQGREADVFLDVVAPVDGQQVGDTVELVGCANVYEANVRYRVLDAGGAVVTDHFTTATCGSGCVGEFRETVDLGGASGELTLEVFWDSPADGTEQDTTRRAIHAD